MSSGLFKKVTYKSFVIYMHLYIYIYIYISSTFIDYLMPNYIYIYIYIYNLALNNLQGLICHKTKPTKVCPICFAFGLLQNVP